MDHIDLLTDPAWRRLPAPSPWRGSAPTLPRRAAHIANDPHPLAAVLMLLGAFFTGYQALRIGEVNFTLSDAFLSLAFVFCLYQGQITPTPFGSFTPLWLAALILILTGLFIGTLTNGIMLRWTIVCGQYLLGYLLLPMMLMYQPAPFVRRLIAAFILGITVMEVVGIIASMMLNHVEAAAIFSKEFISGNGRMASFASEPNWNGELIAFTSPMLVYAITRRILPSWTALLIGPLLAWALLLTASFTGFMATLISTALALLFSGPRQLATALVTFAVAATLFVASGAPVPSIFNKRVGEAIAQQDITEAGTFNGRVQLIRLAWEKSEETIFVGLGVEGFRKTNVIQQPVHNLFLLMLVDGSILSFAGLVMLVGLMLWLPLRMMARARLEAGVALASVMVFCIYTMCSPHMFARLNIIPVIFSLMPLYGRVMAITQK